ncbi:MAG: UTP--glucose-1-phosphate uridylyltransferase [Myxococcales bacterium]|nr:UTP--glucose-1-phosphate uridylyltransferase [Myxococcales bacterium]
MKPSPIDHSALDACIERMRAAEMPDALVRHFTRQHRAWTGGVTGRVPLDEVEPLGAGDLVDAAALPEPSAAHRAELYRRLVVIKLNGGLGTTMHLDRAKSLVPVRGGRSFLDLIAAQIRALRAESGAGVPLLLMDSFRTRDDSLRALAGLENPAGLPLDFLQHQVPRVHARTGRPFGDRADDASWTPPGHGDLYLALHTSGVLDALLDRGYRYAFVSNGDNLGATVDPRLLADFVDRGRPLAMEVTDKTEADRKGGTLVRRGERLFLLERAMVDDSEMHGFLDLDRFPVFNTNSLWVDLMALRVALHGDLLDLPLIVNRKRVDDTPVLQFETAMGAAIGCFSHTVGYRVGRERFAPVKSTADLLVVRSDACRLDDGGAVRPDRAGAPPVVSLDGCYDALDAFEARAPHALGLRACRSLTVEGDVSFGRGVVISGEVTLRAKAPATVADGTRFEGGVWRFEVGRWVADESSR